MMQIFFVLITLCAIDAHAFFAYDSAASLMEQGKWDEAKVRLQNLLVDKPDAPDVLYDAGVASYKTKDYKQARAYFKKVTELPQTQVQLKEQAYFNAGNASAALKEYEDALKQYEMVLNINKSNEKANRNIEKIKELMQRKQQQNQKDSKDKKENKDEKENESSDAQQQSNNEKGNEEDGSQDEKEIKEMNQDSQKQKQQEKGNQEQQGADANQDDHGKDADDKQGQADKSKQEQEGHEKTPDQNETKQPNQGTGVQEKDQGQMTNAMQEDQNNLQQKLDPRLIRILESQEKKDAALNKRMINVAVGQSMGGAQGENCW